MAQKGQEKGVTGPAPVVEQPGRVRNVVLVGHSGAGKTTLVEALLAATGRSAGRLGDQGTTVTDHDPARSAAALGQPLRRGVDARGTSICWAPRVRRLPRRVRAGLRAADAVLFVVSPGRGGGATTALWEVCRGRHPGQWRSPGWTTARRRGGGGRCRRAFGDVLPLYRRCGDGESVDTLMGCSTGSTTTRNRRPCGTRRRQRRISRPQRAVEGIVSGRGRDADGRYLAGRSWRSELTGAGRRWRGRSPVLPVCGRLSRPRRAGGMIRSSQPAIAPCHRSPRRQPAGSPPTPQARWPRWSDRHRPVRGPGVAGAGLLRHAGPEHRAHRRPGWPPGRRLRRMAHHSCTRRSAPANGVPSAAPATSARSPSHGGRDRRHHLGQDDRSSSPVACRSPVAVAIGGVALG